MKLIVARNIVDKLAFALFAGIVLALIAVLSQLPQPAQGSALLGRISMISPLPTPLPRPIVTSIQPARGPNRESVLVTILGANFRETPLVTIRHMPLTDVALVNSGEIAAVVPPGLPAGVYGVTVCNPDWQCTELPGAYTAFANPAPTLLNIEPAAGMSDTPNDVTIYGRDLQPGIVITIGDVPLDDIHWISQYAVQAVVPMGLPAGVYRVSASNPWAPDTTFLEDAYTVIDPVRDDFYATNDDIWTAPPTVLENDVVTLGLNVHRQGGTLPVQVDVAFYLASPHKSSTPIGHAKTALMQPGSDVQPASIEWDTTGLRTAAQIYAVIDFNQQLTETTRHNNYAVRTITIVPPARDEQPPTIDKLLINGGAETVTDPDITVSIDATDTGGSGLHSMLLVEWVFNSNVRQWVAAQNTGWVPFANVYDLTLSDRGGNHYIQAWVADAAGNTSREPAMARVEYIPAIDHVWQGQFRLYQRHLTAGQQVTITLETLSGDADLFVWSSTPKHFWYSDNSGVGIDQVAFTAPTSGTYAIEVFGYEASDYRLTISTDDGSSAVGNAARIHVLQPLDNGSKIVPTEPIVAIDTQPVTTMAIPDPPTIKYAYLPMVNSPTAVSSHAYLPAVLLGQ